MGEKEEKVIIIDEESEELSEIDAEELEEIARNERLSKLRKKGKRKHSKAYKNAKIIAIIGLAVMFLSMLWENGDMFLIALAIMTVGSVLVCVFYQD